MPARLDVILCSAPVVAQGFVLESRHAAIGVIDDDELLRAQQVVRNNERPQGIDPTRVADNVGLASLQPTKLFDRKARIHTGQDRELARRRHREMAEFEIAGVGFIGLQHFCGDGHGFPSELCWKTIKEAHAAAQLHRVYAKLRLRLPAAPATISP